MIVKFFLTVWLGKLILLSAFLLIPKAVESSPDQEVLRLLKRFRNQPQGQLSAGVPAVTETPDTSAGTPAGKLPQADETSGRNRRDR